LLIVLYIYSLPLKHSGLTITKATSFPYFKAGLVSSAMFFLDLKYTYSWFVPKYLFFLYPAKNKIISEFSVLSWIFKWLYQISL